MALIIAGERSGVGKTTVTLAILATLRALGLSVQSFKVGPDYIDPMFHTAITGNACRNLDPVLTSETYVQNCFEHHSHDVKHALVEGVMGLFDGAGSEDEASTAHIARLLNLPILLVVDCSHLSRSVAAIAHGYRSFDSRLQFAGAILNRVGSDRHLDLLKGALEPLNFPILGVLRREQDIHIPDRHLGLIPTAELPDLNRVFDRLATLGKNCFDWEKLLPLLESREPSAIDHGQTLRVSTLVTAKDEQNQTKQPYSPTSIAPQATPAFPSPVKIAIARDRAFNFYYPDNLDVLEHLGASLVFWSPLADPDIPKGIQGLYFGGGFPEVFAEQLSENQTVRQSVHTAIRSGMPTYAECGGLMYLCQQLIDLKDRAWPMVGIVPTTTRMANRLTLGYRQATALQDSPLISAGTSVWGHEFHRSALDDELDPPLFEAQGYARQSSHRFEGWTCMEFHASYIHLHWGANPDLPKRFLEQCDRFRNQRSA